MTCQPTGRLTFSGIAPSGFMLGVRCAVGTLPHANPVRDAHPTPYPHGAPP